MKLAKKLKFFLPFILSLVFRSSAFAFNKDSKMGKDNFINQIFERGMKKRNLVNSKDPNSKLDLKNTKFLNLKMQLDYPSWVSGFVDGEGCFSVSFNRREKLATGIETRPSFSVSQNAFSKEALESLQEFFKCGSIRYSSRDNCYKYEVRNIDDIMKRIIPHFEKYPLKTNKRKDFATFVDICKNIKQNQHLNTNGIKKIINDSYTMNPAGKRKYSIEELMKYIKDKN